MPDESKKNQNKSKHESKEQRKPRQRHQAASNKKIEKKTQEPAEPQKPVYQEPGPEFYKSLKRETDEILKITEEANSKYKKKEIVSNWSKYEMPIESYEEMEEQENLGADYEKLIEAPLSIGGHFQFKHEKTWDITSAPSLYDKYFEIDMDNLAIALCTIPFHERNGIDETIFSAGDVSNMKNRATRYKQKYYNDKSYITPEMEAQDKIINLLKEGVSKTDDIKETCENSEISEPTRSELGPTQIILNDLADTTNPMPNNPEDASDTKLGETSNQLLVANKTVAKCKEICKPDMEFTEIETEVLEGKTLLNDKPSEVILESDANTVQSTLNSDVETKKDASFAETSCKVDNDNKKETQGKPVIESPEDLEKWLDDFLDG